MGLSRIGIALVVAALGVCALSLAGCAAETHADPKPSHSHSAEATIPPKQEANPDVPSAELLSSFKVNASDTPQQMGEAYAAAQSAIWGGRLTPATNTEMTNLGMKESTDEQTVANELAKKWVTPICDTLFIPGWEQNQVLSIRCTFLTQGAATNMLNYTGQGSVQDSYALSGTPTVVSETPTQRVLNIGMTEAYSDSDSTDPNLDQNGRQSMERVTYVLSVDKSQWLISNWSAVS